MVNQKEQIKRAIKQAEELPRKAEAASAEPVTDPLAELLGRAQSAYTAYVEAQKEVAKAYKEREKQLEKSAKIVAIALIIGMWIYVIINLVK